MATATTITSDPGILCFHHCTVKVFCFTLPHTCPHCNAQLDADVDADGQTTHTTAGRRVATTRLLPFRLPYPFVRATQHPCAIVLRPSTGDFLNDYNNSTDLHIAVTTSAGDIVEFDRYGLQRHRRDDNPHEWSQSLLVGDVPEPWYDYWDDVLEQICSQSWQWSIACYEESTHNCYAFVLAFLQALGHAQLSEAAHSKTSFCEKYIVPRTTTAGKYISLYRKLRQSGMYVHRQQTRMKSSPDSSNSVGSDDDVCDGIRNSTKVSINAFTNNSIKGMGSRSRHKLCTIEE
ncbi:MKRN2 opposite strand protein [Drosophila tropicalis]|uniref:MKRN2 opposite strand protein n=1 Tax=Drosophila tropicalis TaxID=46794 RepID=UPI0035ABC28A